jgi:FdhD protein
MVPPLSRPSSVGRMARGRTRQVMTAHFDGREVRRGPDELIVEEPLEIRLDDTVVTTTMRTPGNDFELAVGFCFSDGLLDGAPVQTCRYCGTGSAAASEFNVVSVETGGRAPVPTVRLTTTTSSCGLCGSQSIDELVERLEPLPPGPPFALDVLATVPDAARGHQALFTATGAVHSAKTSAGTTPSTRSWAASFSTLPSRRPSWVWP